MNSSVKTSGRFFQNREVLRASSKVIGGKSPFYQNMVKAVSSKITYLSLSNWFNQHMIPSAHDSIKFRLTEFLRQRKDKTSCVVKISVKISVKIRREQ